MVCPFFNLFVKEVSDSPLCQSIGPQLLYVCWRHRRRMFLNVLKPVFGWLIIGIASVALALAGAFLSVLAALSNVLPNPYPYGMSPRRPDIRLRRITRRQRQYLEVRKVSTTSRQANVTTRNFLTSPSTTGSTTTLVQSTASVHVRFVETRTVYSYTPQPRTPSSPLPLSTHDNKLLEIPASPRSKGGSNGEASPRLTMRVCDRCPARRRYTADATLSKRVAPLSLEDNDALKHEDILRVDAKSPIVASETVAAKAKGHFLQKRHTLPLRKPPTPVARTDPYQAPYFFPFPGSPQAERYVRQVRDERRGAASANRQSFEQRRASARTERSSPPRKASEDSQAPSKACEDTAVEHPAKKARRRWSWHPLRHDPEPAATSTANDHERSSPTGSKQKIITAHRRVQSLVPSIIHRRSGSETRNCASAEPPKQGVPAPTQPSPEKPARRKLSWFRHRSLHSERDASR